MQLVGRSFAYFRAAINHLLKGTVMTASTRNRLHNLIDQLPDRELPAAERYLASLKERTDPFLQALADAPEEEEPLSAEEEAAIEESYARIRVEGSVPDDVVWRRLNHASPD